MTIQKILEIFKKYDIEYNFINKLIVVNEPMLVVDFVYLRALLNLVDKNIRIKVNGNKGSRYYSYY